MRYIIFLIGMCLSLANYGNFHNVVERQFGSFNAFQKKVQKGLQSHKAVVLALDSAHRLVITLPSTPGITILDTFEKSPHWSSMDWDKLEGAYHKALLSSWTIIIPGITGDLAKRKLIPALYSLFCQGIKATIIGTTRRNVKSEEILKSSQSFINNLDEISWREFVASILIKRLDPADPSSFDELKIFLDENKAVNRLIYLSVPPDTFCDLTTLFGKAGIISKSNNAIVMYEKPFGRDQASAKAINTCISDWLTPGQIYRVDHYAAKEFVRSLPSLAHDNRLLSGLQPHTIETIAVHFLETLDVHSRGDYFDRYGILRDIVQNHVLQILSFATAPRENSVDDRIKFLRSLYVVKNNLGQYEGYKKEEHINPQSTTETYVLAILKSKDPQWKHATFVIEAGKAMERKVSDLIITLKNSGKIPGNSIRCEFVPESLEFGISMHNDGLHPITLTADTLPSYREAYESLFVDAMSRQFLYSITMPEIEAQWNIVDELRNTTSPLKIYPKGWSSQSL